MYIYLKKIKDFFFFFLFAIMANGQFLKNMTVRMDESIGKSHRLGPCPNLAEGPAAVLPIFAELHRDFADPTPSTLIKFG